MASLVSIKLNKLRTRKKWTYQQLATFLGVSRSRAHDWCKDSRDPSTRNLKIIAGKLECPASDLI